MAVRADHDRLARVGAAAPARRHHDQGEGRHRRPDLDPARLRHQRARARRRAAGSRFSFHPVQRDERTEVTAEAPLVGPANRDRLQRPERASLRCRDRRRDRRYPDADRADPDPAGRDGLPDAARPPGAARPIRRRSRSGPTGLRSRNRCANGRRRNGAEPDEDRGTEQARVPVLDQAAGRGRARARARDARHQLPALLHGHHLPQAAGDVPGRARRRLRRGHPPNRRQPRLLRRLRRAPVRDDGHLLLERVAGHQPRPRQAAPDAAAGPGRDRPAGHGLRARRTGHRRDHRLGRRRARGREAARGHAGQGRRARRDPQGGGVGDRRLPGARREHPRAGVHQGVEGLRHPRLRRRRPRRSRRWSGAPHRASSAPTSTVAAPPSGSS